VRIVPAPDDRDARSVDDLLSQVSFLEQEVAVLRRRLTDSPRHMRQLEERVIELQTQLSGVTSQNERLVSTLREAREQILALKEEVDRLAQPPSGFGVFLQANEDSTVDVFTGGRKLRVAVSPEVEGEALRGPARRSCSTRRSTWSARWSSSAPATS
jgi:proteasome-associated ATPase